MKLPLIVLLAFTSCSAVNSHHTSGTVLRFDSTTVITAGKGFITVNGDTMRLDHTIILKPGKG